MFVIYHKNMECSWYVFPIWGLDICSWYMFLIYILDMCSWYEPVCYTTTLFMYVLDIWSWYGFLIFVFWYIFWICGFDICYTAILIYVLDIWSQRIWSLDICSWYVFAIYVPDIYSWYLVIVLDIWGRTNLISSIKEGGWTLYAFPPVLVASEARVGRAAGHVKADFCYDRLMGRTNGCRCSQRGENRWGLWWSGRREHSSGRGNFFVTLLQLRIVVFWVGERNKGGEGGGKWEKGFSLAFVFLYSPYFG